MGIEHEAIHLETSSVLFRETPAQLMQVPRAWPQPGAQLEALVWRYPQGSGSFGCAFFGVGARKRRQESDSVFGGPPKRGRSRLFWLGFLLLRTGERGALWVRAVGMCMFCERAKCMLSRRAPMLTHEVWFKYPVVYGSGWDGAHKSVQPKPD